MAGSTDNGGTESSECSEAVTLELMVLDRLLYRNRSQHRNANYFTRLLEVKRACRALAAPKLPGLLAEGLSLIARVPDNRNGRAREAWVRSAAAALRRARVAAVACAYTLECIVQASKHLAYQVSQSYFMALSTTLLACLARLFACNLHFGGRLLEVHGALLRTLLAQPCTSECLPANEMAECRMPKETLSFVSRLRGAGTAHKMARVRTAQTDTTAAAAPSLRGSQQAAEALSSPSLTGLSATCESSEGELGGVKLRPSVGADEGEDEDETGVRVGRVATAGGAGQVVALTTAEIAARSGGSGVYREAGAVESRVGGRGRGGGGGGGARVTPVIGAAGVTGGGREGDNGGEGFHNNPRKGGSSRGGVEPRKKKVFLATDFSDSSSEDTDDATALGGNARRGPSQPPRLKGESETSSATPRRQPPLFFSCKLRGAQHQQQQQQPRSRLIDQPGSSAVDAAASASCPGDIDTRGTVDAAGSAAAAAAAQTSHQAGVTAGRVGWMIDPKPALRPELPIATPSSPSGTGSGECKSRGRSNGGGTVVSAAAPTPRAGGDEDEEEGTGSDGGFRDREGTRYPISTVADTTQNTEGGSPQKNEPGFWEVAAASKLGPDVAATSVAAGAAAAMADAGVCAGAGGAGVGGAGAYAAEADAAGASPSSANAHGANAAGPGTGAGVAATAGVVKIYAAAVPRTAPPELKKSSDPGVRTDAKTARFSPPKHTTSLAAKGTYGVRQQVQEPAGASTSKPQNGVSGVAHMLPEGAGKTLKVGGEGSGGGGGGMDGGGPGTKRSSSGERREDNTQKKMKKQKKQKKGGPNAKSRSTDGKRNSERNAIDDIFASI